MMIGGIFMDILLAVVLSCAVMTVIFIIRRICFTLAKKSEYFPIYTVVVVDEKSDNIEFIVRDIMSQTEKIRLKPCKVILLDNGATTEIREVCEKLCRDYPILCFIEKYQLIGCIRR